MNRRRMLSRHLCVCGIDLRASRTAGSAIWPAARKLPPGFAPGRSGWPSGRPAWWSRPSAPRRSPNSSRCTCGSGRRVCRMTRRLQHEYRGERPEAGAPLEGAARIRGLSGYSGRGLDGGMGPGWHRPDRRGPCPGADARLAVAPRARRPRGVPSAPEHAAPPSPLARSGAAARRDGAAVMPGDWGDRAEYWLAVYHGETVDDCWPGPDEAPLPPRVWRRPRRRARPWPVPMRPPRQDERSDP
jgi:hypothetical protein